MESYEDFINNILETRGRFVCSDEYHERHHIIPRCLGGTDDEDNLIDLFAREHFVAHKMLAYENPDNDKLAYAYICMAFVKSDNHKRYELTPGEYEDAKIALSRASKARLLNPENHPMFGKQHSEATKSIISSKAKERLSNPENHPGFGKPLSAELKEKLRQSHLGHPAWNKGLSVCVGEDNPFYGKHHTEESKEIIRQKKIEWIKEHGAVFTGRYHTEETKQQLRDVAVARFKDPKIHQMYSDGQKRRYESQEERDKLSDMHSITVCQLSKEFDIIAEYKNAAIASESTGINSDGISRCCEFSQITAGNYYWMYKRDYDLGKRPITNNPKNNQPVPVVQLTLNDEFVCEYPSMQAACAGNGYDRGSINKCCLHQRVQAYGFHWMKKDEYEQTLTQQTNLENYKE